MKRRYGGVYMRRTAFILFLISLFFFTTGCINLGGSGGVSSGPQVCVTTVTDKSTGETVFKVTEYKTGSKSHAYVEYLDKDRLMEDEALGHGIPSPYVFSSETITKLEENSTHHLTTFYHKPPFVINYYEKIYSKELIDKYFSDCIWSVNQISIEKKERTPEEEIEWTKTKAEIEKRSAELDEKFLENYEKQVECRPGAFGDEQFIPTSKVCNEEEINKRLNMMREEYQRIEEEKYAQYTTQEE